jgi:hypothetical protein
LEGVVGTATTYEKVSQDFAFLVTPSKGGFPKS